MSETVNAAPAKEFFIRMITRDIALDDCILDLVDNSIDGAKKVIEAGGGNSRDSKAFEDFQIHLELKADKFEIRDNCGGIPIKEAKDYAFHFGRKTDPDRVAEGSIGIYGIGMKRAIFKIGRDITVYSSTEEESFKIRIDVAAWESSETWEFPLERRAAQDPPGTRIVISDIRRGVAANFGDQVFINGLITTIAQDYSLFIRRGLKVYVNANEVPLFDFSLRRGGDFQPAKVHLTETTSEGDIVEIQIIAGMSAPPPDPGEELSSLELDDVDRYGWFVICNDRVVLAGDKSDKTVWGDDKFPRWHAQYNGFLGIAQFYSTNPAALPWTTTKRDIDESDPIYRRAILQMKDLTKPFTTYSNRRKSNLEEAKKLEEQTTPILVTEVSPKPSMTLPQISSPRHKMRNVLYQQREDKLTAVAKVLGDESMSFKDIGLKTFEYFFVREVED